MRESLKSLIENTVLYKYDLPNSGKGIEKTIFSTENDKCYQPKNSTDLAEIIYNSLIEYSYNQFDISGKDYNKLLTKALKTKLKYIEEAEDTVKIKYGFFGEVLLYSILHLFFSAPPLIARGYFYNPLENAETKGYDAYHLIENAGNVELWFGEVKFHINYTSAINSALSNIEKAISDKYFEANLFSLMNETRYFNITGSKIEEILEEWNGEIKLIEEIKKHDIKLVYPILLLYEEKDDYDKSIKKIPKYIEEKYNTTTFGITIPYTIFFILIPVKEVTTIKRTVISWIEAKKPLLS